MTTRYDELLVSDVSSLTGFPVVGQVIGLVDGGLVDLGFARWFRESVELLVLAILLYQLTKLVLRRLIPWFVDILLVIAGAVVDVVCSVLLIPDLALTKTLQLADRRPSDLQYACGHAVLELGERAKHLVWATIPRLEAARTLPGFLIALFIGLSFLWWNSVDCVPTVMDTCSTPVERWLLSAGL